MSTIYSFNHAKLRGRIKEICGSEKSLAERIGMPNNTLSKKLNSKSEFTQNEIVVITEVLEINFSEIGDYFFAH